jgi:hypothetical protein
MDNQVTATLRLQVKEEVTTQMAKARGEVERFQKQSVSLRGNVRDLFRELAGPAAGIGLAAGLGMLVKNSIEAASALQAVQNRARVVFGEDFPAMEAGSRKMAEGLNRNTSEILGFQTSLAAMAQGLGVGKKASEQMAQGLSRLSVDFGKVFHVSDAEAMGRIQSAMEGSTRALREYGIVVNDAILQDYAQSQGIRAKVTDMNAEQRAVLMYNFLMDRTAEIQKTAQKNTGDLHDEVANLRAAWDDMAETLGTPILPIVAKTFSGIASVVRDVQGEVVALGNDLKWVFGLLGSLPSGDGPVKGFGAAQINAFRAQQNGMGAISLNDAGLDFSLRETTKKAAEAGREFQKLGVDMSKGLGGGGGGGGNKAAEEAKRVQKAMADLGREVRDRRRDIGRDLKELEGSHKEKMGAINDEIRGTVKEVESLGKQYQRTVKEIQRAQRDLDESRKDLTDSVDDRVVSQADKIRQLQERAYVANGANGALSQDQLLNIMANRQDKGQALSARDRQAFNLSDGQGEQVDLALELQREEEALKAYVDTKLAVSDRLKQDLVVGSKNFSEVMAQIVAASPQLQAGKGRADRTEFDVFLSDTQKKSRDLSEQQGDLKQRAADEKARAQERLGELQNELTKLEDKRQLETEAYRNARQQFELTSVAMVAFQADYDAAMTDINKVTEDTVDNLKRRLEEMRDAISQIDALTTARADLTGGGTVAQRRETRLANTPDSFLSGSATVTIGSIVINNEQDADALVRRIAREVQLQAQGSSPAR